jgi:hypothetical protein
VPSEALIDAILFWGVAIQFRSGFGGGGCRSVAFFSQKLTLKKGLKAANFGRYLCGFGLG